MKLSEIAEYIADNYPESNIAYNNDVIKGMQRRMVRRKSYRSTARFLHARRIRSMRMWKSRIYI